MKKLEGIKTERGAEILLILVLVARSTSFVMSKVTMNAMNPFNLLGVRFLLAFLLLCIPFGKRLVKIKKENKKALCRYLKETQDIEISPDTIFDIQIKRLHEYKRQQLNALYIIDKYLEIKAGKIPAAPVTAIFGAKAAPAYVIAKDIIHLILCLQEIINHDPDVSPYLKVVMVENYNES